jgi:outer membrane protein insertion porin family
LNTSARVPSSTLSGFLRRLSSSLSVLGLSLGYLFSAQLAEPVEERTIRHIELRSDGPLSRIGQADIFKLIQLREGQPYAATEAKQTIQRLYSTELFHDIVLEAERVGTDQVDIAVVLIRRYFIKDIRFRNAGFESRELRRELAFRAGERYSPELMEESVSRLAEFYQRHGHYGARVTPEYRASHRTAQLEIDFVMEPGEQARVARLELDLEGDLDQGAISEALKTRVGGHFSEIQIEDDITALHRYFALQGYLNPDIYVRGGPAYDPDTNTVSLILRVVPRERTLLVFQGIDPSSEAVRNLSLFTQRGSALAFLEESIEQLETELQGEGYFLADASYEIGGTEDAREITISVNRGNRFRVEAPQFQGNESISDEQLARVVRIRAAGFISRGRFNTQLMEDDRKRIRNSYHQRGFIDAEVSSEVRPDSPRPGRLTPVFGIREGRRYYIRDVQLAGNLEVTEEILRREITSRTGEPYSPYLVAQDRANILAAYESLGYRAADLTYEVSHPEPGHVDIRYTLAEGPKSFTEHVITAGLLETRPSAVRREVVVEPGGPLSLDRILATETNLHNLGIFNRVEVREAPSYRDADLKNVIIRVEEARQYSILYGIGYSSYEGARGTFGVNDSNFLGMARTLSFGLRAGSQRQRANLSYTLNRVFGLRMPSVLSASVDNERALTEATAASRRALRGRPFDTFRIIGSAQAERRVSARESFYLRLNHQNVRITLPADLATPLQFFREEQNLRLTNLSLAYLNESRDDPLNPRSGFFLSGEALFAPKVLASDRQFFRILTQGQYYRELVPGLVLAAALRLGAILPFGNEIADRVDNPVPISERFFSGGATTLRGLPQDLAGPLLRDPETGDIIVVDEFGQRLLDEQGRPDPEGRPVPLGGNALAIANVELRFPLFWFLSGAAFFDNGNVFTSITNLSEAGFSNAFGFGVRANTPVGPVRFDIGYNPDPPIQIGFRRWNFHFTLGHPF